MRTVGRLFGRLRVKLWSEDVAVVDWWHISEAHWLIAIHSGARKEVRAVNITNESTSIRTDNFWHVSFSIQFSERSAAISESRARSCKSTSEFWVSKAKLCTFATSLRATAFPGSASSTLVSSLEVRSLYLDERWELVTCDSTDSLRSS